MERYIVPGTSGDARENLPETRKTRTGTSLRKHVFRSPSTGGIERSLQRGRPGGGEELRASVFAVGVGIFGASTVGETNDPTTETGVEPDRRGESEKDDTGIGREKRTPHPAPRGRSQAQ
ncbi:MAG: hypothetical protein AB4290_25830 [Spirulina sp.]